MQHIYHAVASAGGRDSYSEMQGCHSGTVTVRALITNHANSGNMLLFGYFSNEISVLNHGGLRGYPFKCLNSIKFILKYIFQGILGTGTDAELNSHLHSMMKHS